MPGGGAPSAKLDEETPERDQRPYALQQHEAPLLPMPGVYREDDGADEVRPQVSVGVRLEQAELREHEGHQDEDGAGDLDGLAHGLPSGGRVGPRHGVRYGLTSQAAVTSEQPEMDGPAAEAREHAAEAPGRHRVRHDGGHRREENQPGPAPTPFRPLPPAP